MKKAIHSYKSSGLEQHSFKNSVLELTQNNMDNGKIINENSTRKCVLQDIYKDLKLCGGNFVNSGATNHYFQDFNKLGKWDFFPEDLEASNTDIFCNLCNHKFQKVMVWRRSAVKRHFAIHHGFLKHAFLTQDSNMEEEIEILTKIDHRFN